VHSASDRRALVGWTAFVTIAVTWLAAGLPADGFYSGDSGVKLIAAFNAIRHPARPFDVDLPTVAGRPVPHVDPFFEVHGEHAHALQTPVFPVLSAPLVAVAGLRGAYVWPLLSLIALLPLLRMAARYAAPTASVHALALVGVLASPLVFYALEFWEHVPAVVLLTAATALVYPRRASDDRPAAMLAGVLTGVAVLLRPEALWYASAVAWIARGNNRTVRFLGGVTAPLALFAIANWLHAGIPADSHATTQLALLAGQPLDAPIGRARLWLVPSSLVTLNRESLWHAWPAAVLFLVPSRGADTRRLWFLALATVVGVVLTAPNDGGAQWGPRYLLVAMPPLILLAAGAASDAVRPGAYRALRVTLVAAILLAGLWSTRAAYRELRAAKEAYAGVVRTTASIVSPRGYVVSNVWWFDQVAAPLHETRTFLYARDAATATSILQSLQRAGAREVTIVWAPDDAVAGALDRAIEGTCYAGARVQDVQVPRLTFATATCHQPTRSST
jgi:hypothetical protein